MKITGGRKIITEDYSSENRDLVKRLSTVLNPFLDQITRILTTGLVLSDNFKGKVFSITLSAGISDYKLKWDINQRPTAVLVGSITKDNRSKVTDNYSISWIYNDGIDVSFLGLDAAAKHEITLVCLV